MIFIARRIDESCFSVTTFQKVLLKADVLLLPYFVIVFQSTAEAYVTSYLPVLLVEVVL